MSEPKQYLYQWSAIVQMPGDSSSGYRDGVTVRDIAIDSPEAYEEWKEGLKEYIGWKAGNIISLTLLHSPATGEDNE